MAEQHKWTPERAERWAEQIAMMRWRQDDRGASGWASLPISDILAADARMQAQSERIAALEGALRDIVGIDDRVYSDDSAREQMAEVARAALEVPDARA